MFNLQTQKHECNGAFSPARVIFFKNYRKSNANCPPVEASPLIPDIQRMDALADPGNNGIGHHSGRDGLKHPLSVMSDTANRDLPFNEELTFFAKMRFFSVAVSITAIITTISVLIAG